MQLIEMKKQPTIIVDEAHAFFGFDDQMLRQVVRSVPGIPNATYLANNGQVFVFNKLIKLVKPYAEGKALTDPSLKEKALELLPSAWVSAAEAVNDWGVVPEPYDLKAMPSGQGWMIWHRPLNARVPEVFAKREDVAAAFVEMLCGKTVGSHGDFTYKGQPLTLCDPLDPSLLPKMPELEPHDGAWAGYCALGSLSHVEGFAPLSAELFGKVQQLESNWRSARDKALKEAGDNVAAMWAGIADLGLDGINEPGLTLDEWDAAKAAELRQMYPEMTMLSDASLHTWYDLYQEEYCYVRSWEASRDEDFIFFLMGKASAHKGEVDNATDLGKLIGYARLHGKTQQAAAEFAASACAYNKALSDLCERIAKAVRFVSEDANLHEIRGREIFVMLDMMMIQRKMNAAVVTASQVMPT